MQNLIKELHLIRSVRLAELETVELKASKHMSSDFKDYLQAIKKLGSVSDVFQATADSLVRDRLDSIRAARVGQQR